jgi:hypothetical protein
MKTLNIKLSAPAGFEFIPFDTEPRFLEKDEYGIIYPNDDSEDNVIKAKERTSLKYIPLRRFSQLPRVLFKVDSSYSYNENICIPDGYVILGFDKLLYLQKNGVNYWLDADGKVREFNDVDDLEYDQYWFGLKKKS